MHIANYSDADRRSATAEAAMVLGNVVHIVNSGGLRTASLVTNAEGAVLVSGNYGLAYKVSPDAAQVIESTGVPAAAGSRLVTIAAGDAIVVVGKGAIVEFKASELHASLDPARGGALPTAGEALAVVDSLICDATAVGAITAPVIARCYEVRGTNIRVLLVY